MLFYSSLIISVWARRTRKLIILFIKVAPNCHGKRNNLGAKERDSRREKWREVMISCWPLYCIFLSRGAPRQLVPAPTPSLLCREDIVISFAATLFLLPWQLWATALYPLFTRSPCPPTLERKIKTTVLLHQVDVPKFWGWLQKDNLFFILIFISYYLTEVRLIFHVIKSHSYKFVHVWLTPSIPPPGGLWSQKLGQTAVTNKETRLLIQEKRSPCLTIHSTNLSLLWRSLPILLMVKLHHLSQIDFQRNICRT